MHMVSTIPGTKNCVKHMRDVSISTDVEGASCSIMTMRYPIAMLGSLQNSRKCFLKDMMVLTQWCYKMHEKSFNKKAAATLAHMLKWTSPLVNKLDRWMPLNGLKNIARDSWNKQVSNPNHHTAGYLYNLRAKLWVKMRNLEYQCIQNNGKLVLIQQTYASFWLKKVFMHTLVTSSCINVITSLLTAFINASPHKRKQFL